MLSNRKVPARGTRRWPWLLPNYRTKSLAKVPVPQHTTPKRFDAVLRYTVAPLAMLYGRTQGTGIWFLSTSAPHSSSWWATATEIAAHPRAMPTCRLILPARTPPGGSSAGRRAGRALVVRRPPKSQCGAAPALGLPTIPFRRRRGGYCNSLCLLPGRPPQVAAPWWRNICPCVRTAASRLRGAGGDQSAPTLNDMLTRTRLPPGPAAGERAEAPRSLLTRRRHSSF